MAFHQNAFALLNGEDDEASYILSRVKAKVETSLLPPTPHKEKNVQRLNQKFPGDFKTTLPPTQNVGSESRRGRGHRSGRYSGRDVDWLGNGPKIGFQKNNATNERGNGFRRYNGQDNGYQRYNRAEASKEAEPGQGSLEQVTAEDQSENRIKEEITLEEYEKQLLEKRKALEALKPELRRVSLDKDFETMQLVGRKKEDFASIKLTCAKDKLNKVESLKKDEKMQQSMSITNKFRKPHERRGHGEHRGYTGGYSSRDATPEDSKILDIESSNQFPCLGVSSKA